MKHNLKYFIAVLIVAIFILGSAIHVSAQEKLDTPTNISPTKTTEVNEVAVSESAKAEAVTKDGSGDVDVTEAIGTGDSAQLEDITNESTRENNEAVEITDKEVNTEVDKTFFGAVYNELIAYASEILCALTLIASVTLGVAYKKGLIPLLEKSLVSIGNAIGKIRESNKESAEKNSAFSENIEEKLSCTKATVEELKTKVQTLNDILPKNVRDEESDRLEKKQLRIIIGAQVEMLYDIFMSSSLPQYQKDAIGEKIAAMREAVGKNECEE